MDTSLKRIIAFVIDIIIVSLVVSLINLLPIDPYQDKYKDAYNEYNELIKKSTEDGSHDYKDEIIDINYDVYKCRVVSSVISASVMILYFGVLPLVMNGQTLGKKIMKLSIVSVKDKKLSFWTYLLRIVILNNIWLSLLNVGAVYVCKGISFYYVTYVISILTSLIYMLNLIMVMFRRDNRGLHDIICGTQVIDVSDNTLVVEEKKEKSIKRKNSK